LSKKNNFYFLKIVIIIIVLSLFLIFVSESNFLKNSGLAIAFDGDGFDFNSEDTNEDLIDPDDFNVENPYPGGTAIDPDDFNVDNSYPGGTAIDPNDFNVDNSYPGGTAIDPNDLNVEDPYSGGTAIDPNDLNINLEEDDTNVNDWLYDWNQNEDLDYNINYDFDYNLDNVNSNDWLNSPWDFNSSYNSYDYNSNYNSYDYNTNYNSYDYNLNYDYSEQNANNDIDYNESTKILLLDLNSDKSIDLEKLGISENIFSINNKSKNNSIKISKKIYYVGSSELLIEVTIYNDSNDDILDLDVVDSIPATLINNNSSNLDVNNSELYLIEDYVFIKGNVISLSGNQELTYTYKATTNLEDLENISPVLIKAPILFSNNVDDFTNLGDGSKDLINSIRSLNLKSIIIICAIILSFIFMLIIVLNKVFLNDKEDEPKE
jgi:hypothetical protein